MFLMLLHLRQDIWMTYVILITLVSKYGRANPFDTEAPFLDLDLSKMNGIVYSSIFIFQYTGSLVPCLHDFLLWKPVSTWGIRRLD